MCIRDRYKKKFNIGDTSIIEIVGERRVLLEQLVPFLTPTDEMQYENHPADKAIAYNGEDADEIHIFKNLTQNNNRIGRIVLHDGEIAEVMLKSNF